LFQGRTTTPVEPVLDGAAGTVGDRAVSRGTALTSKSRRSSSFTLMAPNPNE
jgi:hypothetical protein